MFQINLFNSSVFIGVVLAYIGMLNYAGALPRQRRKNKK